MSVHTTHMSTKQKKTSHVVVEGISTHQKRWNEEFSA